MPQDVTMYTTKICPFCDRAKALLKSLGVDYTEIGIESDPDLFRKLSVENNGWRTVPMIFVGKRFIGGFDDLSALHRKGEFLPLLQQP